MSADTLNGVLEEAECAQRALDAGNQEDVSDCLAGVLDRLRPILEYYKAVMLELDQDLPFPS